MTSVVRRPCIGLSSVLCLFLVSFLFGCQSSPVAKASVDLPLPPAFHHGTNEGTSSLLEGSRLNSDGLLPPGVSALWWRSLGSRELDRLVDRALANNPDLRIATLQIVQAKARADQAHAGGLPTITAPVRSAIQAPGGVVGTVPAAGTSGNTQKSFQTSLQATWRLDVWGEQAALNESADLQLARAVHSREDVQRNVVAGVVSSYVSYLALNDALKLAADNEAVASEILQNIEKRVAAQDATLNELEQQRSALFVQQANMPALQQQREDVLNGLAQLLGTVPGQLKLSDSGLDELTLPQLEPGLPSSLLLRRPDIRMVEARMQAANADISVARARLLPPIDLSAQAGSSALGLAQLLQPQSLFWNAIASLAVTVFDGGRRAGDKVFAQAYYEEMVETYGRTVYQAVREVESALSSIRSIKLRLAAEQRATRSALRIFKVSNDAYTLGAIDLTALLESRKNYQRHLDDTQKVKAELLRSQIKLSQALGLGGEPDDGMAQVSAVDGTQAGPQTGPQCAGAEWELARCLDEATGATRDLLLQQNSGLPPSQGWDVELAGLFHRSSVLPVWRDLRQTASGRSPAQSLRVVFQGRVDAQRYVRDAWYRLSVVGFETQQAALDFCHSLRAVQQNCQPTPGTAESAQRVSIARQNGP